MKMEICHPRMSPSCQRCLASDRSRLNGTISYELQKLRLSASSPVAPLRALRPLTPTAKELSLSICPSSKSNALFAEIPSILIQLCVWHVVMYIASHASSPSSCVLARTKAFSHQSVTVNQLIFRLSKQTSQSKSWPPIEVLSWNLPAQIESTAVTPECAKFIPMSHRTPDSASCEACSARTCMHCKALAHDGVCPADEARQNFISFADGQGWKSCFGCGEMVYRYQGCDHMT